MFTTDCVDLLKKLVAVPSVNPDHTDDMTIANEIRMAECVAEELASRGMTIEWDRFSPERASVIASYGPKENPVHTLLLEAHLDTVEVANMAIPPFDPREENGRIWGRGACDTKGPMAAAMVAMTPDRLERLAAAGVRIIFVGAYGEERGNAGARHLVEQGLGADTAIILEPTDLDIVYAHKGVMWIELLFHGRSGHGSDPARGINAISAMSRMIAWLEGMIARDQATHGLPDMGMPTLNIGRISGGVAMNVVAQQCRLHLDRRVMPGEQHDTIFAEMKAECDRLQAEGAITAYDLTLIGKGQPFKTDTETDLVQRLKRCLSDQGHEPQLKTAAWFSDAGPFASTCKELIVFGPGSILQAHTADEFIEVSELRIGAAVLGQYLDELALDTARAAQGASPG